METPKFSFEKLDVYQLSLDLTSDVYQLLRNFPDSERYCLCSQLQRSIISVPSNIAEGSGRISYKEKIHFLEIAFGSLLEAFSQLQIAQRLSYLTNEDIEVIRPQFNHIARYLNALKNSFKNQIQKAQ